MLNFFRKKSDPAPSWVCLDKAQADLRQGHRLLDPRSTRCSGPATFEQSDSHGDGRVYVSAAGQRSYSAPVSQPEALPVIMSEECPYSFNAVQSDSGQTLERARWCGRTIRHVAPWVTLVAGPGLVVNDAPTGPESTWCFGMSYTRPMSEPDLICLGLDGRADLLRHTTHHELFHIIERWLTPEAMAIADGPRGSDWESDPYLSSGEEQRANRYAHWAMLHEHGMPMPGSEQGRRDVHALYWQIYSGKLGAEVMEVIRGMKKGA